MAVLQEFKCPCCDGAIEFDSGSQKMKCPFCDTEFEVETLVSYNEEIKKDVADDMQWDAQAGQEWSEDEQTQLRTYVCRSCAGEILADATTGATECPYCGSPTILPERIEGGVRPELVIPFTVTKEQAQIGRASCRERV